ncbi:hypothetical protein ACH5RR_003006 [Cinchona calisaya]|uniref:Putative plant transposon protein domain-containing protein n=1 Tax=Cinchona calisaya TaxID=153742 RepID=A0ABD3ATQ4_9GENT
MGNKRKAMNSTALVELEVVHYSSHEPKVALDKNRFVSIEAQMFYDKLALIASPCVRERFVREDATVGNDTIVREFIVNTHKLTGTVVQELCDPHVPEVWYHFLTSRILPITHFIKVTRDRAVFLYAWVKDWFIDIGLEIQMEILRNGAKDQPSFIFLNLITSLCTKAGVTLCTGSKNFPDKPISSPWIRLTLKKHDKSLQDLIAKQQPRAHAEQVVLNSQNHGQQGIWELPPPAHPDYVFRRPRTEPELRSLAVYRSRSLHALDRKLDILAHQLHPTQPLNLANWPLELDAPSWHFGLPDDGKYGPGSEESEDKWADHAADDEVGPSGRS